MERLSLYWNRAQKISPIMNAVNKFRNTQWNLIQWNMVVNCLENTLVSNSKKPFKKSVMPQTHWW